MDHESLRLSRRPVTVPITCVRSFVGERLKRRTTVALNSPNISVQAAGPWDKQVARKGRQSYLEQSVTNSVPRYARHVVMRRADLRI